MAEPEHVPGRLDARYRAFLETVGQLRPKLHRYCARMTGSTLDGEDLVQDALFDAYRRLDTYDDSRPIDRLWRATSPQPLPESENEENTDHVMLR